MDFDVRLASKEINELLWNANKTLSTAESCTAGRISSVITAQPGSSNYYIGGLICYATEMKVKYLGVSPDTIDKNTVMSEAVVKEMIVGANKMFGSDYAVAISGFAGPGGPDGTGKPGVLIGTIWIAVGSNDNIVTYKIEEDKGRERNLEHATNKAIHMLLDYLKENCPKEF